MNLVNVTLKVASLNTCEAVPEYVGEYVNSFDPMWRQTMTGCKILHILQDMFKFEIEYVIDSPRHNVTIIGDSPNVTQFNNQNIDVYVRSMTLTTAMLNSVYPVHAINTWRFGFLLSRDDRHFFTAFYNKPFSRQVWDSLYIMALVFTILFYILKKWEYSVLGGSACSVTYEVLMIIGGFSQHIPPIDPKLPSRRLVYLIFFVFAYTVYTFYTSNLLSNLVNDKNVNMDLKTLAESDYEFVIVNYMKLSITGEYKKYNHHYSFILSKLLDLPPVTVPGGLEAVKTKKVGLLSDFTTIYPYIKSNFDNDQICKLISVNLLTCIQKYYFTSKKFPYKEEFKVGTLRIKESGVLRRIVTNDFDEPKCTESHLKQILLKQISIPLTFLFSAYFVTFIILLVEILHYKKKRNNQVWPYVD